ncbi:hypothetical protein TNCV_3544511 [Trichonephila clavipes]|nr:hypothetical protein TNCV_3544511 [Trichonephila clavipes]
MHIYTHTFTFSNRSCPSFSSRGASFNLQPQKSLGDATEYQTWLLEAVELRLPLFLTTWQEIAGRTIKLEG